MNSIVANAPRSSIGYALGVSGLFIMLMWLGIYKFTPTEAALIQPLVLNHFAMGWLYNFLSVQMVSNIIGTVEIIVAMGLLFGLKLPKVGFYSGIAATVIFAVTLSFLLTTPNTWKVSDGVPVANFFLVKDILFLAMAVIVAEKNWYILKQKW